MDREIFWDSQDRLASLSYRLGQKGFRRVSRHRYTAGSDYASLSAASKRAAIDRPAGAQGLAAPDRLPPERRLDILDIFGDGLHHRLLPTFYSDPDSAGARGRCNVVQSDEGGRPCARLD
jgi:hypothetical protein